jgi:acetyltransferase-like isoleucine patch superfamily enzyme
MGKLHEIADLRYAIGSALWRLEASLRGAQIGDNVRFYGRPIVRIKGGSSLSIGNNVRLYSGRNANPLGLSLPCVLRTLSDQARIEIGSNSGMSGCTVCAGNAIHIGRNTIIGAGSLLIDNDFHLLTHMGWINDFSTNSAAICIGDDVFIGARCIILKGVHVGNLAILGAGSVVTRDIPESAIAAGNPATIVGTRRV